VEFSKIAQAEFDSNNGPFIVWRKNCPLDRAIVAWLYGKAHVLYSIGPRLEYILDYSGIEFSDAADDPPSDGIWVWEGKICTSSPYEYPLEVDEWLEGTYRALTPEEWAAVCADEHPWDPALWIEHERTIKHE